MSRDIVVNGRFLARRVTGVERYARVQVGDTHGRCAWTNPLFVRTMDEEG